MNVNADFGEQVQVVSGFVPVDMQSGTNTGDWVSLKHYEKITFIFFKAIGTATEDPTLTIQEATNVAGGTATNLVVIDKIYKKQAATDLLSTGTFTVVSQTASHLFVGDGTSAEEPGLYMIDVYASDLSAGFDCINASINNVGSNPQLGCMLYLLWPARYNQQTLESAIVD